MFVIPFAPAAQRTLRTPSVDQLVADTFDSLLGRRAQPDSVRTPAMDVSETDAAFHLVFDVPGVRKDQLKVSIEGRRLSLETLATAEVSSPTGTDEAAPAEATATRALYRERRSARYARTVSLPAEVDQSASQARVENGVLTLVLAKKVPTGATVLSIS